MMVLGGCAHQRTPSETTVQPVVPAPAAQPLATRPTPQLEARDLNTRMRSDAPLRYVVKPGDTLWDIAGYYLRDPWYWPQLWDDNPDIANPHLIYPGEVLVLTRNGAGQPRLQRGRSVRLSPRIREQEIDTIATIPLDAIRAFIDGPRLVSAKTLEDAPYVVSFIDEHLVGGKGTTAYIRDADTRGDAASDYSLVRDTGPYTDPVSGEVLGREAVPVGDVHIDTFDEVSTGLITKSFREALVGDRLLPLEQQDLVHDFYPHAPATPIEGRIISVFDGVSSIGQYQIVTLSVGRDDGIERGHVLDIFEAGRVVLDPVKGGQVQLPPLQAGELMVFKTDARVSFALIMRSQRPVHVKDIVRSPQA
ncbi:LysM peptidoglycan-binding domain-containing protein [Salinisphaera aquimarina]|uniref:LysM peptidoglycan-binding domain-containing protein n=1 Tax=Salinisphaera aquimarina TaxID=2094031 RepID=A0ABV7ELK4_9GAMM